MGLIIGEKAICDLLGVCGNTLRALRRYAACPVRHAPGKGLVADLGELADWYERRWLPGRAPWRQK